MQERLQKFLAAAGVASRRQAEQLMLEGRVTVNGAVIQELGFKVDPSKDAVKVDGKRVLTEEHQYVLLFKPKGTICTLDDPEDRPTVVELVKGLKARVYPVGRLDFDTTGALLLTNDGELANQLMHPRHRFAKTYVAKVKGIPTEDQLDKLRRGVHIEGHKTAPAEARLLQVKEKNSVVELVLREGRNKQVKRMFLAIGHSVLRLHRAAYGFLTLEGLEPAQWRTLSEDEVKRLRAAAVRASEGTDDAPAFRAKIDRPLRAPRPAPRRDGEQRRSSGPRSSSGPRAGSSGPRSNSNGPRSSSSGPRSGSSGPRSSAGPRTGSGPRSGGPKRSGPGGGSGPKRSRPQ